MANRFCFGPAFVCMVAIVSSTQAGVILNGSGHAIEVTDVLVGGIYYDVTFAVGSYNSVFGTDADPDPLPTFDGLSSLANAALAGIRSQLNAASVSRVADALGVTADSVIVPFSHTATSVSGPWTGTTAPLPWGSATIATGRDVTGGFGRTFSFAQFTSVPEPSSVALLVMGSFGLAGLRLRRKQQVSVLD